MSVEKEIVLQVKVSKHDQKTMILRQSIGEGSVVKGDKFTIGFSIPTGDPCWYFGKENRYYTVSMKELTEKVVDVRQVEETACNRTLHHNGGIFPCIAKGPHQDGHLFELPDVDTRIEKK